MNTQRKIIHIDMDAFYASVEQRDRPELRGRPVIVGGQPDTRGVVAACSYEARKYGIHSAMPASRAARLCPDAVFIPPRFKTYRSVSQQIQQIFRAITPLVEPLSLDEAYLDVSDCQTHQGSATLIARELKQQIRQDTGLIASAGVSYNKFLAKMASDMDKPDGLYLISPDQGLSFIRQLAIGKFFGIGKATEKKMQALGIMNGADLSRWSEPELVERFGKAGHYYFNLARGVDDRPVRHQRVRKSLGKEHTYQQDLLDQQAILTALEEIAEQLSREMREKNISGHTLTVKIKYDNFEQITRSRTIDTLIKCPEDMSPLIRELLRKTEVGRRKIRLLGISLSNLSTEKRQDGEQLGLFV